MWSWCYTSLCLHQPIRCLVIVSTKLIIFISTLIFKTIKCELCFVCSRVLGYVLTLGRKSTKAIIIMMVVVYDSIKNMFHAAPIQIHTYNIIYVQKMYFVV